MVQPKRIQQVGRRSFRIAAIAACALALSVSVASTGGPTSGPVSDRVQADRLVREASDLIRPDDTAAKSRLSAALAAYRRLGLDQEVLRTLRLLASFRLRDDDTEAHAREAVRLGDRLGGDPVARAADRLALASILYLRIPYGKASYSESDKWARGASTLVRPVHSVRAWALRARAASFLGVTHGVRGDQAASERCWEEAERFARLAGDWERVLDARLAITAAAAATGRIAAAYSEASDLIAAIQPRLVDMRWAADWRQLEHLRRIEAQAYRLQADIAASLSAMEAAIGLERRALRASRQSGLYLFTPCQADIATWLASMGRRREAETLFRYLLATSPEAGDTMTFADTRLRYSAFLVDRHRYDEALAVLAKVRRVATSRGFGYVLTEYHTRAGEIQTLRGRPREAIDSLAAAWRIVGRDDLPEAKWRIQTARARAFQAAGQSREAYAAAVAGVTQVELYYGRTAGAALAAGNPLSGCDRAYHQAFEAAWRLRQKDEAFQFAERAKCRLLREALAAAASGQGKPAAGRENVAIARLRREVALTRASLVRALYASAPDMRKVTTLRRRLDAVNSRLDAELAVAALGRGGTSEVRQTVPIPWAKMPALARSMRSVFLYYFVGDGAVYLSVVSSRGLRNVRLPVKPGDLDALTGRFLRQARSPYGERSPELTSDLYRLLVAPAEATLDESRRIIVMPDGPLWKLPFAALVREGKGRPRYLIETHELVYCPSITTLQALLWRGRSNGRAGHRPSRQVAVFCSPRLPSSGGAAAVSGLHSLLLRDDPGDLPSAMVEAAGVRSVYGNGAAIFARSAATLKAAEAALTRYRVVHFATHAVFLPQSPLGSGLFLSPDKRQDAPWYLDARTLAATRISASLVVFNACDSGRGFIAPGEGLVGLTWATFIGGARSQVASLWPVQDAAGARLMADFYRELKRTGRPSRALQIAQRSALARPGSRPSEWAGLICLGAGTPL